MIRKEEALHHLSQMLVNELQWVRHCEVEETWSFSGSKEQSRMHKEKAEALQMAMLALDRTERK